MDFSNVHIVNLGGRPLSVVSFVDLSVRATEQQSGFVSEPWRRRRKKGEERGAGET